MPYINEKDRDKITQFVDNGGDVEEHLIRYEKIEIAGELQYAMALIFQEYVITRGMSYQTCNDIMGALAGAQMEFYRRNVASYEDKKIKENGDV